MSVFAYSYSFVAGTAIQAAQVNQNQTDVTTFLNNNVAHLDGSKAFTGQVTLPASDPTNLNHAARKSYVDAVGAAGVPPGTIAPYAGTSEPGGWLFCAGQAVNRTTYATLFTVVSTTYGAGDGSTTFNVPDLRGRVAVALDNMGGADAARLAVTNTLGAGGGQAQEPLTTASAVTVSKNIDHTHNERPAFAAADPTGPMNSNQSHSHGFDYSRPVIDASGNLQPYLLLNYIIRT